MNGVYCLTFPNGKRYVGKSVAKRGKGIENRWQKYKKLYKKYIGKRLFNALKFYGPENVKFDVLLLTNDNLRALALEKQLVALWNTTNKKRGYNHFEGGVGEYREIKVIDKKIGICKIKNHRAGKNFKKGHKINLGRHLTEETKIKMKMKLIGQKRSEETKNNIRNSLTGMKNPRAKLVGIKNVASGEVYYGNITKLARDHGFLRQKITTDSYKIGWILIKD